MRIRRPDLDAFLAASSGRKPRSTDGPLVRFVVAISDSDTTAPKGEPTPRVWSYEIESPGAEQAVAIGLGQWRKEVGGVIVAQSIAVTRAQQIEGSS